MFTYCNNNVVNQVDPEGTDAIWRQFGQAVPILWWHEGHTSVLVQDDNNEWWYFYWGPKHAILCPCGKVDFTISELNSYLSGFDPRKGHNYFVYATKAHDGIIDGSIYFNGKFSQSYKYARDLLNNLFINTNANQKFRTVYENGNKVKFWDVCYQKYDYRYNGSDMDEALITSGYNYEDIKPNSKSYSYSYDGLKYNCVQASMNVLLHGTFKNSVFYRKINKFYYSKACRPNTIYNELCEV